MIILIKVFLLLISAGIIGYPLFFKDSNRPVLNEKEDDLMPQLLFKKEMIYTTLKEIDFDLKSGKISAEDHQELHKQYENEAINILSEIDLYKKDGKVPPSLAPVSITTSSPEEKVLFCTTCGKSYKSGDRFCNQCGKPLTA